MAARAARNLAWQDGLPVEGDTKAVRLATVTGSQLLGTPLSVRLMGSLSVPPNPAAVIHRSSCLAHTRRRRPLFANISRTSAPRVYVLFARRECPQSVVQQNQNFLHSEDMTACIILLGDEWRSKERGLCVAAASAVRKTERVRHEQQLMGFVM